ncbi:MAG TPA: AgmX/PglI C-terminal domain-containing protein [Myxococcota bacterium]|nr:AgmX/PglI C-terminal domain-containing protein [Myxococcota bacterium]
MSDAASQSKVLKIGVVVDDNLVEERVVAGQQSVSVGRTPAATFQLAALPPVADDESPDVVLFLWRDNRYHLRFLPTMKGQFTLQGEKQSTTKLAKVAETPRDGDWFIVALDEDDKGFVNVGPAKVLFRFVEAPVLAAPAPVEIPMDFRPRLLQDDDPVFLGMLGLISSLALVFALWVANTEPRKLTLADLGDDLRNRQRQIAKIIQEAPKETVKEAEKAEAKKEDKVEAKKEEVAKAKVEQPRRADSKVSDETLQSVRQTSALFQAVQSRLLAGRGDASRGTVLLGQGQSDLNDLSGMIQGVKSVGVTNDGSMLRPGTTGGGTGDRTIGELSGGADGGGHIDVGPGPKIAKPDVATGDASFDGGEVTDVKRVVKNNRGMLLACHENALKTNPKVAGRVTVEWMITGGKAIDVFVVENTTDDKGLEACVVSKLKRWSFAGLPDGNARQSFIFEPKEE